MHNNESEKYSWVLVYVSLDFFYTTSAILFYSMFVICLHKNDL